VAGLGGRLGEREIRAVWGGTRLGFDEMWTITRFRLGGAGTD